MKISNSVLSALVALAALTGTQARADNMASIAISPATGTVTLTPRWGIGGNLGGFHQMSQDLGLGGAANNFYSIKGTAIPAGGDILAFNLYSAGSGAATPHADIGSKLTPNSYSALTSADPDVGYGSVNFYLIHHKGTTDYFSAIIPGSAVASAVTDEKPMSGPGGPGTVTGVSGYFGLTFAAANLGYGLNQFYYLRTDPATGTTKFGTLAPALLGTSADQFDLGDGSHKAFVFTGSDVGFGVNKMYYLRLDPVTGFTILGMLDPALAGARHTSDVANLGSVYTTLTFVPGDLGFGSGQFYTTGAVNPTWQSVSFAAIADRAISAGSFTVAPSASSGLAITLSVVAGSTGAASISGPVGGVFTVTPTAPGIITLQATQAGQTGLFEFNMLRQSFTASGLATLAITTQPTSQSAVTGGTANFSVVASGTTTVSYQWRKGGTNIVGNASALTANLALGNVQATDAASYDVVVSNASGSLISNPVTLTLSASPPVITNTSLSVTGTAGTPFNFTITASNSPTSYSASSLPSGLSLNTATGAITGTPSAIGGTPVIIGATNAAGTGTATLTINIAGAAGTAPVINNASLSVAGNVNAQFTFLISASGFATSYNASTLPPGLSIASGTGAITGIPTVAGTTTVQLSASNASGTGTAILTITIGAEVIQAPVFTSPTTAAATAGTPVTYLVAATGSPTSYSATGLPAGLTLNTSTGAITGTPTTAGTSVVTLTATNATGTTSTTLTITVAAATVVAPVITSPTTASATAGTAFTTYLIAATGLPTSYSASGLPAGLSLNSTTGAITGTPQTAGSYVVTLTATNSAGTSTAQLTITVAAAAVAPTITSATNTTATVGASFPTYFITATGGATSYSATGLPAGLSLNSSTGAITGTPTVAGTSVVTISASNNTGTTTTTLTIVVAGLPSSRIVNFSARALSGPGDQTLVMGFVIAGDGKNLLVRGIGPGLLPYGVTNVIVDPMLTLFNGSVATLTNDDWQITASGQATATVIAATALRVGAFALPNASKDSALMAVFNNGAHTTSLVRANSTTGVALTEIYDTDLTGEARLINVSARMNVSAGEGTLIAGMVIKGDAPKTVLIRGIGPTLSRFAVNGVLADPQITVFAGATVVATNDNWEVGGSSAAQITATSAQVGAFALVAGSKDAALLVTLQPGSYTVQINGVGNTTGVALIEIYDTQ